MTLIGAKRHRSLPLNRCFLFLFNSLTLTDPNKTKGIHLFILILFQIMKGWVLGPELCDMWTSCDVLCCTASILHLVAIAVDR